MNLAVLQLKGGVGKTPLSFILAKNLGLNRQSNDDSVVCGNFSSFAKKL